MSSGVYTEVKLLKHIIKIVERVLERRKRMLMNLDNMPLGFTPGKGMTDALLLTISLQEKHREKGKHHVVCGYRESVRCCPEEVDGVDKVENRFTRELW